MITDHDWHCDVCNQDLRYGFTPHWADTYRKICNGHPRRINGKELTEFPEPEEVSE